MKTKLCDTINISIDTYMEQQYMDVQLSMDVTCSMGDMEEKFTTRGYLDLTQAGTPELLKRYMYAEMTVLWSTVMYKLQRITHGKINLVEEKECMLK